MSFLWSEKCRHSAEMFGLGQEMTLHGVHHCRKTDDQSHAKNQSTLRQNRQNDDVYKEQSIQKHDLIITLKSLLQLSSYPKFYTIYCDANKRSQKLGEEMEHQKCFAIK